MTTQSKRHSEQRLAESAYNGIHICNSIRLSEAASERPAAEKREKKPSPK